MTDELSKFFDLNNFFYEKNIQKYTENDNILFMKDFIPKNNMEKLLFAIYLNGEKNKIEIKKIKKNIQEINNILNKEL